ncbi:MAG: sugar phosphate isomerase/epimerase [Clostridia bacterium]|nr:sugar phosphate isomerase/epimerase [Clostridia bacterium]
MKLSIDNGMLLLRFGAFESMKMIKDAGFDCVDMTYYMSPIDSPLLNDGYREYALKLKEHLDCLELECNQAHAPFVFTYGDRFTLDDPHYRAIVRSIESASILGAKEIVVHSVGHRLGEAILFDRAYNLAYYRSLIPYCEKFGIRAAVENLVEQDRTNGGYVGRLGTPQELSEFVEELGSPCFCACLDTGHASLSGIKPEDFVVGMSQDLLRVLHVHDGDYLGDRHTLPYLMDFDWKKIMSALKQIGYDGELTFEILNYFRSIPLELIPASLRFAERTGRYLIDLYNAHKE